MALSADYFIINAFNDLKLKSSGGGGFSDGGLINKTEVLKASADASAKVVEIAPLLGVAYGAIALASSEGTEPAGNPVVVNFGTTIAEVEEYLVTEDGSETLIDTQSVSGGVIASFSSFFSSGARLQYPNKLRYKVKTTNPAAQRVLLKYALMEFDLPADQQ